MSRLSLYLMGPPRVECDGVPIEVDTRKAIALLAYISITGERHRREALVNLLWPEYDERRGRAALRRTLSTMRKALPGHCLDIDRKAVGLDPGAETWVDVSVFRSLLPTHRAHPHTASDVCPDCVAPLTQAVALYRGDFMAGFTLRDSYNFDDWQFFQGEDLRRDLAGALQRLVVAHRAQGRLDAAIRCARRWLSLDRLCEEAHAQLICLHAERGDRTAALRQYEECVRVLDSQLSVAPQPSTVALYEAIVAGAAPQAPGGPTFVAVVSPTPTGTAEREPPAVRTEKRIVTVLLADVRAGLRRRQVLLPEDEAALTAQFLEVVRRVLPAYRGHLYRRFAGSALAAFEPHESAPEWAIRAALDVREQAAALGLQVATGISTGEALLVGGPAAGGEPFELVGSVVDEALHLAGRADPAQILVAEPTYRLAWRAFAFARCDVEAAGERGESVPYEVVRLRDAPQAEHGLEGLRADLVGREAECTLLHTALAKALHGHGQMVSLIGEAGLGKSRLIAELHDAARVPDERGVAPLWLEGHCMDLGTAPSYAPFLDILRSYLAWGARDGPQQRRERIATVVGELSAQGHLAPGRTDEVGALIARLFALPWSEDWDRRLAEQDPGDIHWRTFRAVRDLVAALSRHRPLVLVFEDLHWADDLSLDLIATLLEGLPERAVCVVCAYRPEHERKSWHLGTIAAQKCGPAYTELRLRELSTGESRHLVSSLLGGDPLPPSLNDLILIRSQGNPYYLEEIIRSLIDAQILYRAQGTWRVREAQLSPTMPDGVQAIILSRLDRLDRGLRQVVDAAAVVGRVFGRRVLAEALGAGVALDQALWALEDRALIYQERTVPEVAYSFKHVLTREAVYRSIVRDQRRALHVQVARAIEALYRDRLEAHYERLAHHYEEGGERARAADYLLHAGDKARRENANEAAIAHLTRGLDLLDRAPPGPERTRRELDLLIALGVPAILSRGHAHAEVARVYQRAEALSAACSPAQRFQIIMGLRRVLLIRGDLAEAHARGEELLALARQMGDPVYLCRAHMMQGEALGHMGQFAAARAHFAQSQSLFGPALEGAHLVFGNDTEVCGVVFGAPALWYLGYPDRAAQAARAGVARAEALGHPFTLCMALHLAATVYRLRREADAVADLIAPGLEIATQRGFALYAAWGEALRGWVLVQRGQLEDGIGALRAGIASWREIGARTTLPEWMASLAEAYAAVGWVDSGLRAVDEGLALADRHGEGSWVAELHRTQGVLHAQRGAVGEAEARFQRAIEVARAQEARSWELRAAISLARLWAAQGEGAAGRGLLDQVLHSFTEGGETVDQREARALVERGFRPTAPGSTVSSG
jgi:DNA-binding SARP family transcriptional activator